MSEDTAVPWAKPEELLEREDALSHSFSGDLELDHEQPSLFPDEKSVISGTVDIAPFVKAYAEYMRVVDWFLHSGNTRGDQDEYIIRLTTLTNAKSAFIRAQDQILKQLGVT